VSDVGRTAEAGLRGAVDAAPVPATDLFAPARRTRSSDDIVEQIRDAVLSGRLQNGDRLPNERDLCGRFAVSRSTLREGLRTLEALGVVEIRPGAAGGIFVSAPDGEHVGSALEALLRFRAVTVDELAEFRVSFEGETAFWAALRAEDADVERLEELAQRFGELAEDDATPWQTLVPIDLDFHQAIADASKNQVRVAIMLGIHRALHRASSSLEPAASPELRRTIGPELRGIARAVRARNARLARERMRRHVKRFSELARALKTS
jgi:GntR family transcriptional regulator, transcriptional repressor for pyruvate dehydrogenase complex